MLLSGFFTLDIPDLLQEASRYSLAEIRRDERDTWAAVLFKSLQLPMSKSSEG